MMKKRMDFTRKNPKTKKVENTGYMELKDAEQSGGIELYIYGDIVSTSWDAWSMEDTCPQDIADFMSGIDGSAPMTIYINSGGGDVFAGIAIHSILKRHTGRKTGVVDGLAASIASVILMACDEIVMASGAQIMIHKPSTIVWGNADDLAKMIVELDKCQKSITDIYMLKAKEGVTEEEVTGLINAETWMNGEEAKEVFDITVEERPVIAACVSWMMDSYRNKPQGIRTESVEDAAARQQAEEQKELDDLLDDLDLYGT